MEEASFEKKTVIIKAVLESGHSVELPATGYSMFPALRPGDIVTVKPLTKDELPVPGEVVVFWSENSMVMHRLIKITRGISDEIQLETQGDSLLIIDTPQLLEQLAGIALFFKRNGKQHNIETYIPGLLRYKYNRRLLWLYNKLIRVRLLNGLRG